MNDEFLKSLDRLTRTFSGETLQEESERLLEGELLETAGQRWLGQRLLEESADKNPTKEKLLRSEVGEG